MCDFVFCFVAFGPLCFLFDSIWPFCKYTYFSTFLFLFRNTQPFVLSWPIKKNIKCFVLFFSLRCSHFVHSIHLQIIVCVLSLVTPRSPPPHPPVWLDKYVSQYVWLNQPANRTHARTAVLPLLPSPLPLCRVVGGGGGQGTGRD